MEATGLKVDKEERNRRGKRKAMASGQVTTV